MCLHSGHQLVSEKTAGQEEEEEEKDKEKEEEKERKELCVSALLCVNVNGLDCLRCTDVGTGGSLHPNTCVHRVPPQSPCSPREDV